MNEYHILAVGATGMLRQVCVDFAQSKRLVTVVARSPERLTKLEAEGSGRIFGVSVDYRQKDLFQASLKKAVEQRGPFEITVAWIREDVGALNSLLDFLWTHSRASHLFHIKGNEEAEWPVIHDRFAHPRFRYHQILLGSVETNFGRRWLTHQEIVLGVEKAVREEATNAKIGERKESERGS